MKIKEMNISGTKVEIHDDYIVDKEEQKKILERIAKMMTVRRLEKDDTA